MKTPRSWLLAAAATLALWSWQALLVNNTYGGDWTALYLCGDKYPFPPSFPTSTYLHKDSYGYDGQWYRRIAHDPLLSRGYFQSIDAPEFRYRRILLPALAWLFAAGNPAYIDPAFNLALLLAVFLTTAFAALWLPARGLSPLWALLVPLLPGVLACANRMTVDVAFYAAIPAAFLAAHHRRWSACWLACAAAALSRDLGFLLPAAFVLNSLGCRRWRMAASFASSTLPAIAWYLYLRYSLPVTPESGLVPQWLTQSLPGVTHLQALFHLNPYPFPPWIAIPTHSFDRLMLLGAALAALLAFNRLRKPALTPLDILLGLFAVLYLFTGNFYFWSDILSAARGFTPMFALLALSPSHGSLPWRILPLATLSLRVFWEFASLTLHSLRGLL